MALLTLKVVDPWSRSISRVYITMYLKLMQNPNLESCSVNQHNVHFLKKYFICRLWEVISLPLARTSNIPLSGFWSALSSVTGGTNAPRGQILHLKSDRSSFCFFAESVRDSVGRKVKLSLRKRVKLEVKGDKTENRVLVSHWQQLSQHSHAKNMSKSPQFYQHCVTIFYHLKL